MNVKRMPGLSPDAYAIMGSIKPNHFKEADASWLEN